MSDAAGQTGVGRGILVIGATGKQGSCVVRSCLELDRKMEGAFCAKHGPVLALTRNKNSSAAAQLENLGATLMVCDMEKHDEFAALVREQGPKMVFLMMAEKMATFSKGAYVKEAEATVKMVLDACKTNGSVEYVVFSSVSGVESAGEFQMPNFAVKGKAEQLLKESGLKWTILRPVTLMDSFMDKELGGLKKDVVVGMTNDASTSMWYVSCRDVGVAAATCFDDPERHAGKVFECAAQNLSGHQIVDAYKAALSQQQQAELKKVANMKWKPVLGGCLMKLILPDYRAMHKFWCEKGYPITDETMQDFKTLVAEPWTIEDYFRSLGYRIPQK